MRTSRLLHHLCSYTWTLLTALLLMACTYNHPQADATTSTTSDGVDSLAFTTTHHYWLGYNFKATDSLHLLTAPPLPGLPDYGALINDTIRIHAGDRMVVAKIRHCPTASDDKIWVKLARDQRSQGWIAESRLLTKVMPDDPISAFIYHFSGRRTLFVLALCLMALLCWMIQGLRHKRFRMVHVRDIPSFYPTLLCLTVSASAALYGSLQRFVPDTWVEFYYHPTLNPFLPELPPILMLFILSVWLLVIEGVAVVDEMRRQPDVGDTLQYLAALAVWCMVLYLVFSLTTPYIIGYPLLVVYWYYAIRQYYRHRPSHLLCGICGHPIPQKGKCPHCGAINQ